LALLVRGLRGRRVGDEPHCACGYLLHGLESKVCPECGEALTARRVRYGTRHRIRWQVAIGGVCLAVALPGLGLYATGVAQRIDWYRLAPIGWLASAAESGNRNALAELDRRLSAPKINASDFRAAVETGLRVQKDRPPAADLQAWLNLLSKLESTGCMTPADRNEFFSRIVELSLVARSKLRQGDPLTYRVEMVIRAPNIGPLMRRLEFGSARLGDQQVSSGGGSTESTSYPGPPLGDRQSSDHFVETTGVPPGRTHLALSIWSSLSAVGLSGSGGNALWSQGVTLTAPVAIVPPDAPDPLIAHRDKNDVEEWRRALNLNRFEAYALTQISGRNALSMFPVNLGFVINPPVPFHAIFDVVIQADGRRETFTRVEFSPDSPHMTGRMVCGNTTFLVGKRSCRVILIGSRKTTLAEPGIDEFLDGEIDLGEFTRGPERPAATSMWLYERSKTR